ncbi:response regulator [Erythrobacter dokdonensis]|jgi:DNA-binding NarL/FixJ family response regulator|uniref:Two component LuxR family transcriptional regulator n=1 Tax=Erythrobacter dokdonensis DSW-74 TaxID=1300349 RepID=A0A1A7BH85_9SPHN|nr:response regulator transcription factor [Erythrobacter dokdonensis]MEE4315556.1 response regulator transcription factor [Erythrobacter sp.]OBV11081.1 Two component LuxR family transcriptional regulator [Erythrobacter dokdonensis DSW-74]
MNEALPLERVLIVDDHGLVRDGLRAVLLSSFPACEIAEAGSFSEALDQLEAQPDIDIVLLDLNIPDATRFSALEQLRGDFPSLPVVMVSGSYDRVTVRDALAAGAAGFLPKTLDRETILDAIQQILAGEIYVPQEFQTDAVAEEEESIRQLIENLTPQQRVVLGRLVAGRLNKQIAHELDISMTTVKAHVSAILCKLNVFSRTQAVILANKIGFDG